MSDDIYIRTITGAELRAFERGADFAKTCKKQSEKPLALVISDKGDYIAAAYNHLDLCEIIETWDAMSTHHGKGPSKPLICTRY